MQFESFQANLGSYENKEVKQRSRPGSRIKGERSAAGKQCCDIMDLRWLPFPA